MKSWTCQSNWSRNLHKLIYKFNMTLPVDMVSIDLPVKWRNQHVMMPWPVLPFSSWLTCIFNRTGGQPVLAGYTHGPVMHVLCFNTWSNQWVRKHEEMPLLLVKRALSALSCIHAAVPCGQLALPTSNHKLRNFAIFLRTGGT